MFNSLTLDDVIGIFGLMGIAFTVFLYFRTPQEKLDKKQALSDKDLESKATVLAQKEMESKAALLAQQVESEKIANEKRFGETNTRMDVSLSILKSEILDVDRKVDALIATTTAFHYAISNKITEIATILSERLPPK